MGKVYTDDEIRDIYEKAKDKERQIIFLAKLTEMPENEIRYIVKQPMILNQNKTEKTIEEKIERHIRITRAVDEIEKGENISDVMTKYILDRATINRAIGQRNRHRKAEKAETMEITETIETIETMETTEMMENANNADSAKTVVTGNSLTFTVTVNFEENQSLQKEALLFASQFLAKAAKEIGS